MLKAIRKAGSISQEELGRRLGVSYTTVNRWESGRSRPHPANIQRIEELAQLYGVWDEPKRSASCYPSQPRLTAFSLFSGGGGFDLGMEGLFQVAVSTDFESACRDTHKANWPDRPFICKDIRRVAADELVEAAGGIKPDLVFGGPPCQGFSTLGDKFSADPRNHLFEHFARLVQDLQPRLVLLENVASLTTMYQGQYAGYIAQIFSDMGYRVFVTVLDAAEYGVPQHRRRVFFACSKLKGPFAWPSPTHGHETGKVPFVTVGDALAGLPEYDDGIPNHIVLHHSDVVIERYRLIPEGGRLPPPEQLPERIRRGNFGNTYKRLDRQRPSLTLVPGNNALPVHPVFDRSLTPREGARIQTFPDSFVFRGDRRSQCKLVGNAVPPRLAKHLAEAALRHFMGEIAEPAAKAFEPERNGHLFRPVPSRGVGSPLRGQPVDYHGTFVDLFAGAGGFTLGFARAGWKPVACVDHDENVRKTHELNHPELPFACTDLSDPRETDLLLSRLADQSVDLVVGGPPCQGFSIFGKRRFVYTGEHDPRKDPRNHLIHRFVHVLRAVQPRWFVMENVVGLTNLERGKALRRLMRDFAKAGFGRVEARVLNAADYGVPQLRRRLLIIGNRTGHVIPWPKPKFFESPRDWQEPYRTVGEAIYDLSTDASLHRYTCHVPMEHKPMVVERFKFIPEGGKLDLESLPPRLRTGYRTDCVKNYSHIFRRLDRDAPSITLVPGHNAFPIHPWLHRALTVREAARLQTFPDWFEFCGSRQNQCIQVGNAFPPLLAELIGSCIRKAEVNGWLEGSVPASALNQTIEARESYEPLAIVK